MALDGPYSSYKAAHHRERLDTLRRGEQINPTFVELIISDLCNESCSFCAYRMDGYTSNEWFKVEDPVTHVVTNNPNRMIPYEKCIEILDDCVGMGINGVEITGGGEPTVHPKHREIFEAALDRGMSVGLVSNGVILRPGVEDLIANFAWARFSIDAANSLTYSQMREVPESFFDKVIKNVEKVVAAKRAVGSNVVLGLGFVVTKENYKEILGFVRIASELGVDNARLSAVFTPENAEYFKDIYLECRDEAREAVERYQRPDFKVFNLFGDRFQDLEDEHPEYEFCGFQQFQAYIGGDQNVYRCCSTAYNPQGFIGSLKFQSFKELWNSEAKKKNFASFDAKTCERCMFNNKNRFINYLISKDPKHVDFV
jgi:MoaA/NifB/PqqE/SkfB family radical SAM enzyme